VSQVLAADETRALDAPRFDDRSSRKVGVRWQAVYVRLRFHDLDFILANTSSYAAWNPSSQ
jgi:hypothetical protein